MQKTSICPKYEFAAELLGKKWTGLLILVLLQGPLRFKDIKREIPDMSDRLITERLKELEGKGIVERSVFPEKPVRVQYQLTSKGEDLEPVINAIQDWAEAWVQ